jgi:hypothetical protein
MRTIIVASLILIAAAARASQPDQLNFSKHDLGAPFMQRISGPYFMDSCGNIVTGSVLPNLDANMDPRGARLMEDVHQTLFVWPFMTVLAPFNLRDIKDRDYSRDDATASIMAFSQDAKKAEKKTESKLTDASRTLFPQSSFRLEPQPTWKLFEWKW